MAKLSLSPTSSSTTRNLGKLSLNKETLSVLGTRDLERVNGGTAVGVTVTTVVPGVGEVVIVTIITLAAYSALRGCLSNPCVQMKVTPKCETVFCTDDPGCGGWNDHAPTPHY